jgi:hypothetical protein
MTTRATITRRGKSMGCVRRTTLSTIDFLFHDDPPKLPEEGVDVRCPPFSSSAINFNRDSLPTSFSASSVKDHVNIGVTGETLFQSLVHQRNTTRNDKKIPPHRPPSGEESGRRHRHEHKLANRLGGPTLTTRHHGSKLCAWLWPQGGQRLLDSPPVAPNRAAHAGRCDGRPYQNVAVDAATSPGFRFLRDVLTTRTRSSRAEPDPCRPGRVP